jgi:hypothetical protein
VIVLHLRARDVDALISQNYDTIKVYRDVAAGGSFNTLIGTVYPLVMGQEFYDFVDNSGNLTNFYELSYYRSIDALESGKSVPFSPSPASGPLGILTVDFVRNTTDIPGVANLDASKVSELIVRTETELFNYANRFGGLNTGAANYSVVMPLVGRLLLEEIYLRSRPTARTRIANGLASERIGSYSYTTRGIDPGDAGYWTAEIENLLVPFLIGNRFQTHITTTRVFKELPTRDKSTSVSVRRWHDLEDIQLLSGIDHNIWAEITNPVLPDVDNTWWDI